MYNTSNIPNINSISKFNDLEEIYQDEINKEKEVASYKNIKKANMLFSLSKLFEKVGNLEKESLKNKDDEDKAYDEKINHLTKKASALEDILKINGSSAIGSIIKDSGLGLINNKFRINSEKDIETISNSGIWKSKKNELDKDLLDAIKSRDINLYKAYIHKKNRLKNISINSSDISNRLGKTASKLQDLQNEKQLNRLTKEKKINSYVNTMNIISSLLKTFFNAVKQISNSMVI